MKLVLSALRRGKVLVLALLVALTLGAASTAMGHTGFGGLFHKNHSNAVNAISTFVGSVAGPILSLDNNNANGTALDLQVEPNRPPLTVNSTAGKATNLNADQVDGKNADDLSRVAVMNTSATTVLPTDFTFVTYGVPLSITAPADGFVRVNGNVTVSGGGCTTATTGCFFTAYVRHINSGNLSIAQEEEVINTRGNAGLDAVFPVSAGVNTFDIRLIRSGATGGQLRGWFGVLTAEYTPYGATGTGTLNASGSGATFEEPSNKGQRTR